MDGGLAHHLRYMLNINGSPPTAPSPLPSSSVAADESIRAKRLAARNAHRQAAEAKAKAEAAAAAEADAEAATAAGAVANTDDIETESEDEPDHAEYRRMMMEPRRLHF